MLTYRERHHGNKYPVGLISFRFRDLSVFERYPANLSRDEQVTRKFIVFWSARVADFALVSMGGTHKFTGRLRLYPKFTGRLSYILKSLNTKVVSCKDHL